MFTSLRQHPLYYASVILALCRSRVVNHGWCGPCKSTWSTMKLFREIASPSAHILQDQISNMKNFNQVHFSNDASIHVGRSVPWHLKVDLFWSSLLFQPQVLITFKYSLPSMSIYPCGCLLCLGRLHSPTAANAIIFPTVKSLNCTRFTVRVGKWNSNKKSEEETDFVWINLAIVIILFFTRSLFFCTSSHTTPSLIS